MSGIEVNRVTYFGMIIKSNETEGIGEILSYRISRSIAILGKATKSSISQGVSQYEMKYADFASVSFFNSAFVDFREMFYFNY